MIVKLWRTKRRGQELSGTITWEDGELTVDANMPDKLIDTIFRGPVPEDPEVIELALRDMPRRWDGFYLRAEIVGMAEGGPGSGWFAPPRGDHVSQSRDLSYKIVPPGESIQRYAWEADIRANWGDQLRRKIGIQAIWTSNLPTYGIFDGDELVGVASMAMDAGEPTPQWTLDAYPYLARLENKRVVYFMATKRAGYGEELLTHLREQAAETGHGIWLSAIWEAEGFYEAVGGTRLHDESSRFYWDVLSEATKAHVRALEPWHGAFCQMPEWFWEGGPGSGWFAPPKGTHGPGSQGGKTLEPGTGTDVYQVGITSHRPGKDPRQLKLDMGEFVEDLQQVAEDVDVQLGTGGWEGGSEPTWITRFRDGADALAVLAATGKRHNQDAVLVMRYTAPGEGSPLVRLNFSRKLGEAEIRAIEAGLVENGVGGWTWAKAARGTVLLAACVPQWGGQNTPHMAAMGRLQEELEGAGYKTTSTTNWVETTVMERGEYDRWTG